MPEIMPNTYRQPALSINQQIDLLISRGLLVPEREKASHYLQFIGYSRLVGYGLTFQQGGDGEDRQNFHHGTTFDMILDVYIFDRKLRLLVMDPIERIEVAVRSIISNHMSIEHEPHWFMDANMFEDAAGHREFITLARRAAGARHNAQIRRYRSMYNNPDLPPSWMLFELLSFGQVSRIYESLSLAIRKEIARIFALNEQFVVSWLHALSYTRNLCAHHSMLYSRRFTISPKIANRYREYLQPNNNFYAQAVIIHVLLQVIAEDSGWVERLEELFAEHPQVLLERMGFPQNWRTLPFWRD